jgi:hypothetical protein
MMFEDPEEYDEKIIAENEQEIPYTDENEIDEIVNDIVSELRAFGYFPTVRTISMGGYPGAIEVSGWDRDNSSKIEYRIDIGTNVLHLRRTVTVPFPSEEPWEEEEEESEEPWETEWESPWQMELRQRQWEEQQWQRQLWEIVRNIMTER